MTREADAPTTVPAASVAQAERQPARDAPLVSILVRSMGRPQLHDALASIGAQSHPALEAVVVAACGPDHPPVPAQAGHATVRLVVPTERLPRPRAANAAIDAAQGEWLGFLDDDDRLLPGHVEALLASAGDARLAYGRTRLRDMRGAELGYFGDPHQVLRLLQLPIFHLSGALFHRDLVARGARFDESLAGHDDTDFWLQCSRLTTFSASTAVVSEWAVEDGSSGLGFGRNADPVHAKSAMVDVQAKWAAVDAAERDEVSRLLAQALDAAAQQPHAALEAARRALALRPRDLHALSVCAMLLARNGRAGEPVTLLEQGLRIAPSSPELAQNLRAARRAAGLPPTTPPPAP
jgi:hypothetical protein